MIYSCTLIIVHRVYSSVDLLQLTSECIACRLFMSVNFVTFILTLTYLNIISSVIIGNNFWAIEQNTISTIFVIIDVLIRSIGKAHGDCRVCSQKTSLYNSITYELRLTKDEGYINLYLNYGLKWFFVLLLVTVILLLTYYFILLVTIILYL